MVDSVLLAMEKCGDFDSLWNIRFLRVGGRWRVHVILNGCQNNNGCQLRDCSDAGLFFVMTLGIGVDMMHIEDVLNFVE